MIRGRFPVIAILGLAGLPLAPELLPQEPIVVGAKHREGPPRVPRYDSSHAPIVLDEEARRRRRRELDELEHRRRQPWAPTKEDLDRQKKAEEKRQRQAARLAADLERSAAKRSKRGGA